MGHGRRDRCRRVRDRAAGAVRGGRPHLRARPSVQLPWRSWFAASELLRSTVQASPRTAARSRAERECQMERPRGPVAACSMTAPIARTHDDAEEQAVHDWVFDPPMALDPSIAPARPASEDGSVHPEAPAAIHVVAPTRRMIPSAYAQADRSMLSHDSDAHDRLIVGNRTPNFDSGETLPRACRLSFRCPREHAHDTGNDRRPRWREWQERFTRRHNVGPRQSLSS